MPDQVESSRITLKQTDGSGKAFGLSDSSSKMVEAFGTPASTSNALAEMDDTTINRYNNKGMEVYFEGSRLFSLKIKGDAVSLYLDGKSIIKSGDRISTIGTLFPNSPTH